MHFARRRAVEPSKQVQQGALSSARRPHDSNRFTTQDREIQLVENWRPKDAFLIRFAKLVTPDYFSHDYAVIHSATH